ncbi:aladin-like [Eurosta solidaginis]|uniref:aladin-like n=1 Tax=Eurosta solidaginis TaxID=178769 RepID=UPI003530A3B4
MAWRPLTAAELAVGCQKGVCLWTVDTNMHITRSATQAVFLKHPGHCPITSVQWNANGTWLATASISDTDMSLWDVDRQQNTPLRRVGPPCSLLKWSPDAANLFSATVGNVFRVWSANKKWTPERWTINCGVDEQIFASGASPKEALKIAELTKFNAGRREVGGEPQVLAWGADGGHLAVMFKDTPEYPSYVCFQSKTQRNTDTGLTIGWSSGRIEYFPFGSM